MANRVMSMEEKLTLSTDDTFQAKCKQAIRDFATFWYTTDGAGIATEAERITWVKNRMLSVAIVQNPIVSEDGQTIAWFFLNAAKGKVYDLATSPVSASVLIAAWDAASSFEEFVNDYFKIKGEEINFVIGGN